MIVRTYTEEGYPHLWWKNVLKAVSPKVHRADIYLTAVESLLAEHNIKVKVGFYSLEFDTEQDYVMFMLKWC